ncbi:tRNA-specific adenosine deaminase, partial [Haemophilus influenzae]
HY